MYLWMPRTAWGVVRLLSALIDLGSAEGFNAGMVYGSGP